MNMPRIPKSLQKVNFLVSWELYDILGGISQACFVYKSAGRILREIRPFCSFCREPLLSKSPVSYPVSRLAANLQREVKELGNDLAKYHLAGV